MKKKDNWKEYIDLFTIYFLLMGLIFVINMVLFDVVILLKTGQLISIFGVLLFNLSYVWLALRLSILHDEK